MSSHLSSLSSSLPLLVLSVHPFLPPFSDILLRFLAFAQSLSFFHPFVTTRFALCLLSFPTLLGSFFQSVLIYSLPFAISAHSLPVDVHLFGILRFIPSSTPSSLPSVRPSYDILSSFLSYILDSSSIHPSVLAAILRPPPPRQYCLLHLVLTFTHPSFLPSFHTSLFPSFLPYAFLDSFLHPSFLTHFLFRYLPSFLPYSFLLLSFLPSLHPSSLASLFRSLIRFLASSFFLPSVLALNLPHTPFWSLPSMFPFFFSYIVLPSVRLSSLLSVISSSIA